MMTNRSAPTATVVPILVYPDVGEAMEWLCRVFGFTERLRAERDGVIGHAQLSVGNGAIMLGRQGGPFRAPHGDEVTAYVHVTVDDVDSHCERAQRNAARILQRPHDMPFGERQYSALDPAGHRWTFSQHVADVAPEAWGATERSPADRQPVNHQQDVIPTLLDYYKAFSTLEVPAIVPYFHEPALLVGPQGTFSAPTHETLTTALTTLVDSLRARRFGRSELRVRRVEPLSASTALLTGIAVRYTVDGSELERVGVTYVLQRSDSRWKIAALVVHDPDEVAPAT